MVSEILDIKNMTGRFSLIFPLFSICIKNTVTKKVMCGTI